jgi:tetratricopeptide (TPR) repeat protein
MSSLQKKIEDKIDILVDEAFNMFTEGKHEKSFSKLYQALELIPEPKEDYGESFNILKYIIEDFLTLKDTDNAKLWSHKIFEYSKVRLDCGEKEFLMGKILFESGQLDEAKELFKIAFQKSKGRIFAGEPKKYVDLLKK